MASHPQSGRRAGTLRSPGAGIAPQGAESGGISERHPAARIVAVGNYDLVTATPASGAERATACGNPWVDGSGVDGHRQCPRVRLDRKTVRRFGKAEVAADLLGPHGRRATELDPHLPYLATRWQAGQHVAAFLFDEIRQKGYRGSKRTLRRQLAGWRTAEPPPPAHAMLPGSRTLA
jgi:hypothetical protein